ncbi:MAG: hypothetical protein LBH19_02575, partial [Dysgonamonadaceae bacterium]|nr:hypothetical protein [Dysgonamonadaceae bacterium]
EKGKLSFVLPLGGSNKKVTYATPVTGTDAEYEIKRLVIFWFKDGGTGNAADDILHKRYCWGDNATSDFGSIAMTTTQFDASHKTGIATINVGADAFDSKFYIVANVNGNSVTSKKMLGVKPGDTTGADFEAMLADALAEDAAASEQGSIVLLSTPLPMSINASGTNTAGGYIAVSQSDIESGTSTNITAHLKRRVARFDVINNADYSNFKISRIYVSRAPRTGYLHDRPFDDSNVTMWSKPDSVGKFVVDTSAVLNLNGTPITDKTDTLNAAGNKAVDGIPDVFQGSTPTADKDEVNGPAFYLWPTIIDVAGTKTEIVIEGAFGSDKHLYKLDLSSDMKIEANKVYRIKVMRQGINMVKFALEVDDWYDIVEVEANGTDKSLSYVDVPVIGLSAPDTIKLNGSTAVLYTYSSTNTNPVKLSFETVGKVKDAHHNATSYLTLSPVGVVGVDYLQSDWDALEAAENAVTYTTTTTYASQYVTKYELNLPPTDAPITVKLKIVNAANSAEAREIELTSDNVDKSGKPLMQVGQVLDASTAKLGQGRWVKAVVATVSSTTTLPSKYDPLVDGCPQRIIAQLGTMTTDNTTWAPYYAAAATTVTYICTTLRGVGAIAAEVVTDPDDILSGTVDPSLLAAFSLTSYTNNRYKAIRPILPKTANYVCLWNDSGSYTAGTSTDVALGAYGSPVIALINY